jgi:hypothetical protein
MPNITKCNSCGAEIFWVVTEAGRRMPVDAKPVENGNIMVTDDGKASYSKGADLFQPGPRYVSHFATCPDGAHWRTKGTKAT